MWRMIFLQSEVERLRCNVVLELCTVIGSSCVDHALSYSPNCTISSPDASNLTWSLSIFSVHHRQATPVPSDSHLRLQSWFWLCTHCALLWYLLFYCCRKRTYNNFLTLQSWSRPPEIRKPCKSQVKGWVTALSKCTMTKLQGCQAWTCPSFRLEESKWLEFGMLRTSWWYFQSYLYSKPQDYLLVFLERTDWRQGENLHSCRHIHFEDEPQLFLITYSESTCLSIWNRTVSPGPADAFPSVMWTTRLQLQRKTEGTLWPLLVVNFCQLAAQSSFSGSRWRTVTSAAFSGGKDSGDQWIYVLSQVPWKLAHQPPD